MAQVHAAGHGYHLSCLALRPAAHIADLLVMFIVLWFLYIRTGWVHILVIVFIAQSQFSSLLKGLPANMRKHAGMFMPLA